MGTIEGRAGDTDKRLEKLERRQQTVWEVLISYGIRLSKLDGIDPKVGE
jgi:hypothetical protein